MSKNPQRVLKRSLDRKELRIVTSDELLGMSDEAYQQIRRQVTIGIKTDDARYICARCGHPVYAPHYKTGPGWKHVGRDPIDCAWWTGKTSSVDEVSARQFQGQQESPLHLHAKSVVAKLLAADDRVTDIVVDEILHGAKDYKKPDVRAKFGERPIAVEMQLSTTQIPVIIERELFYEREGWSLIWLTWDFEPCPYQDVRQAFRDIATAHSENLFTIDAETIDESERQKRLVFRSLWWDKGVCHHRIASLDDLTWPEGRLPFLVDTTPAPLTKAPQKEEPKAKTPSHQTQFPEEARFEDAPEEWALDYRNDWPDRIKNESSWNIIHSDFWMDLLVFSGFIRLVEEYKESFLLVDIVNLAISFDVGHPIASGQKNLVELMVTFLSVERRWPYAQLAQRIAIASGHSDILDRTVIKKKLETAIKSEQLGGKSPASAVISILFPEWVRERADIDRLEEGLP